MSVAHLGALATSNTFNHGTRPRHHLHSRFNSRFHPHRGHYRRHVVIVGKIISVIVLLRISDSFGPLVFRATLLKLVYFCSHFIVFFLESSALGLSHRLSRASTIPSTTKSNIASSTMRRR